MLKLLRVIGTTKDGLMVVGDLMYGKIYKNEKTYYIRNNDNQIIECVSCVEDTQNLKVEDFERC